VQVRQLSDEVVCHSSRLDSRSASSLRIDGFIYNAVQQVVVMRHTTAVPEDERGESGIESDDTPTIKPTYGTLV